MDDWSIFCFKAIHCNLEMGTGSTEVRYIIILAKETHRWHFFLDAQSQQSA